MDISCISSLCLLLLREILSLDQAVEIKFWKEELQGAPGQELPACEATKRSFGALPSHQIAAVVAEPGTEQGWINLLFFI